MDQRVTHCADYMHVYFDRRLFLGSTAKLVGSVGAVGMLTVLQSSYALAAVVAENDAAITTRRVTFPGATGDMMGYLAEPKNAPARRGSVVVIHGRRGLIPHFEDVARRLAKEGYNALAVDFLSPLGGTPADEVKAVETTRALDRTQRGVNAVAAAGWLRGRPESNGKTAVIGFCWGGGAAHQLAVHDPLLTAASVYYGSPPTAEDVAKIQATLLLNYADPTLDTRLGEQLPGYEAALKANNKKYTLYTYPGAEHAFNEDTGDSYHKTAADLAWSRTIAWLKANLS